jgi:transposase
MLLTARIALEAVREDAPVPILPSGKGVNPKRIRNWKKQVVDDAPSLFGRGMAGSGESMEGCEREATRRYAKIGQLAMSCQ